MIYQLIYIALTFIGLGVSAAKNGEDKKGKHNVWSSIFATAVIFFILYKGGFFNLLISAL